MTVRLPRRFAREDQDTFLERLIALLENIVDTVADQGVTFRKVAPGAVTSSGGVAQSNVNTDVTGGFTELDSFDVELLGGSPLTVNCGVVAEVSEGGSGRLRYEIDAIIRVEDSAGNVVEDIVCPEIGYIEQGDTVKKAVPCQLVSTSSPSGLVTVKVVAQVSKLTSAGTLGTGVVDQYSISLIENKR